MDWLGKPTPPGVHLTVSAAQRSGAIYLMGPDVGCLYAPDIVTREGLHEVVDLQRRATAVSGGLTTAILCSVAGSLLLPEMHPRRATCCRLRVATSSICESALATL